MRYNDRYYLNSDPSITDSDNDGLIDPHEVKDNTCLNPFNKDSDGDTILDGNDPDPCGVFPPEEEVSLLVIARDFALGAALGDMGMPGGILERPQEVWSSPYYLLGHIISGFLPIGDIRDVAENIRQGDVFGAAINAVGLIPVADVLKVADVIKNYIKYAPASKVDETFVFINRVLLDNMPASLTEPLWKLFGKGAAFTRFADEGLSTSQIRFVAKLAGSFPGKSVDDVGRVIKRGGEVAAVDLKLTSFNPSKLDEAETIIKSTVFQKIGQMNTFIKEESTGTVVKITVIKLLEPPKRLIELPQESLGALYDYYQWEDNRT